MAVPVITATLLGARAPGRPLLVAGPSLGTTTALWEQVAASLGADVEMLGIDLPGHGASPAATASFTVEELAAGILAAVEQRRGPGATFFYAGDSLGGAAGLALALLAPQQLLGLAPMCTGAKIGEPAGWHERAALIRSDGTDAVVEGSRQRWFAPGFTDREPALTERLLQQLRDVDDESYALACEALAGFDLRDQLHRITAPTVVVSGELDVATPPETGAQIAAGIGGARQVVLDDVAHLAPVEAVEDVTTVLRDLIRSTSRGAGAPTNEEKA